MRVELLHGDCREVLASMPEASVDAIVTDPPYELGFMGKRWDAAGVAYDLSLWGEALRVLKPGGHLLAFGGTRTYHRMACAIEDAGFEIRDSIHYIYGSGFPKSLDVSKAIDKRRDDRTDVLRVTGEIARLRDFAGLTNRDLDALFGFAGMAGHWTSIKSQPAVPTPEQWTVLRDALRPERWVDDEVWRLNGRKGTPGEAWAEREVVGERDVPVGHSFAGPVYGGDSSSKTVAVTEAATDEARRWEGWGTALKPAHEPIVVARKPLVGTVAGNVLAHGTGALNIDGCRVPHGDDVRLDAVQRQGVNPSGNTVGLTRAGHEQPTYAPSGRWPANVVFDSAAGEALDAQSGPAGSNSTVPGTRAASDVFGGWVRQGGDTHDTRDSGGASRFFTRADFGGDDWPFFYCAKPGRKERNAGLDGLPEKDRGAPSQGMQNMDGGRDRMRQNHHPTVKPVALMRHLVRLVTPPGGVVLDPFAGSGTTLVAAILEGFDCIGVEMTEEYLPIIEGRVAWAQEQVGCEPPRLL